MIIFFICYAKDHNEEPVSILYNQEDAIENKHDDGFRIISESTAMLEIIEEKKEEKIDEKNSKQVGQETEEIINNNNNEETQPKEIKTISNTFSEELSFDEEHTEKKSENNIEKIILINEGDEKQFSTEEQKVNFDEEKIIKEEIEAISIEETIAAQQRLEEAFLFQNRDEQKQKNNNDDFRIYSEGEIVFTEHKSESFVKDFKSQIMQQDELKTKEAKNNEQTTTQEKTKETKITKRLSVTHFIFIGLFILMLFLKICSYYKPLKKVFASSLSFTDSNEENFPTAFWDSYLFDKSYTYMHETKKVLPEKLSNSNVTSLRKLGQFVHAIQFYFMLTVLSYVLIVYSTICKIFYQVNYDIQKGPYDSNYLFSTVLFIIAILSLLICNIFELMFPIIVEKTLKVEQNFKVNSQDFFELILSYVEYKKQVEKFTKKLQEEKTKLNDTFTYARSIEFETFSFLERIFFQGFQQKILKNLFVISNVEQEYYFVPSNIFEDQEDPRIVKISNFLNIVLFLLFIPTVFILVKNDFYILEEISDKQENNSKEPKEKSNQVNL